MKEWLPIQRRNQVALGLTTLSLVTFVWWNLLPGYEDMWGRDHKFMMMMIWPELVDYRMYLEMFRNPSGETCVALVLIFTLFQNAFAVFLVIPFWRFVHSVDHLRITLGVVNLLGGMAAFHLFIQSSFVDAQSTKSGLLGLFSLSMLAMAAAMMVFKNELAERHEMELKERMLGEL